MRLAIIDVHDNILRAWPNPAIAHADIAEQFAAKWAPHRWQKRKRERLAKAFFNHLAELQDETRRL